jgi:hypothetical protein
LWLSPPFEEPELFDFVEPFPAARLHRLDELVSRLSLHCDGSEERIVR